MWNSEKKNIFSSIERGTFELDLDTLELGTTLENEWWKLIYDETVIGFGWINYISDDFEISFVVSEEFSGKGFGSFIISELEKLAKEDGFTQTLAIVKQTNPNSAKIIKYLYQRNYSFYIKGFDKENIKQPMQSAIHMVGIADVHLSKIIN